MGIIKSRQISESQRIPLRFLEIILSELRQGGFVKSIRGNSGGYVLARPPEEITVAQVINFIDGHKNIKNENMNGSLASLQDELYKTCFDVLDSTTFNELAEEETRRQNSKAINYVI